MSSPVATATHEVANKLAEFVRAGNSMDAIEQLYADDIVSVEAMEMPGMPGREMRGKEAIKGKNQWWYDNHEVHSANVHGPYPHDDRFAMHYMYEVTPKGGEKMQMHEVGLYTVKNGKIVKEEFFYGM